MKQTPDPAVKFRSLEGVPPVRLGRRYRVLVLLPVLLLAGGWLGSSWGSRQADSPALRRSLAAVLLVAALKFVTI